MTTNAETIVLRSPEKADGLEVYRLVDRCKPLDLNSCYAYLLLCTHFSDTCVLAEMDGGAVGFVSAYVPPERPDTVFVWQVAVDAKARGQGLAGRMLDELLARETCRGVTWLETTISPSNIPSQRLFRSWAERRGADCRDDETLFDEAAFGAEGHEAEVLFRIGPLKTN